MVITRRRLIKASGVAALVTVSPSSIRAIEPFNRTVPGKLRLSLSAYSLRDELRAADNQEPTLDLFGFVNYCKSLGLSGAELTSYYFPGAMANANSNAAVDAPESLADDPLIEFVGQLKRHCHLAGVTVSGGAIGNDFTSQDATTLRRSHANVQRWIRLYQRLGAQAIRIFAGNQPKSETWDMTRPRLVEQIEIACQYAHSNQMMLALENHGGVTATAEQILQIVREVDSPAFGINLDSGNFRSSDDPYRELEAIAPYAINAQLKVEVFPGGVRQETDVLRVVKLLRDAGYSGWLALEYEADEPPREAIPKWIERIQKAIEG